MLVGVLASVLLQRQGTIHIRVYLHIPGTPHLYSS